MKVVATANQKTIEQIIESTSKNTTARKIGELGKDDFLNLLITQLKYQDPLEPVDDKEFIGQMAQFTSLEQMQNMNGSLSKSQAFSLIGKYAAANIDDEKTGETKLIKGIVTSAKINKGKAFVVINGEDIPIDQVTDVTDSSLCDTSSI